MFVHSGRWRFATVMLASALAVTLAGCSSSDSKDSAGSTVDDSLFGTPDKATGTPIVFGYIGEGTSAAIDSSAEIVAAQAAAAYANDYLGGVGGHPIEIKVCETKAVPATATDCANQMVSAGVSAVLSGTSGVVDQMIAGLSPAGIPLITHTAPTAAGMSTPGVFSLFNGLSYFGAPAAWAQSQGIISVDQIVIGVPTAEGSAKTGSMLFGNAGVQSTVTSIPPGTADMTPNIATAAQAKPGLYHVTGNDTFCTSVIKAVKTIDPKTPITMIDRCISTDSSKSIPGGYEGIEVAVSADLSSEAEDTKLFQAIAAKYGDGLKISSGAASGYAPTLGTIRALNAASITDTNPTGILAALKSAPPVEYPMSGGIMFQCNGKQISLSPNVCSSDGIMATATSDGTLENYRRIPADPELYALPTS